MTSKSRSSLSAKLWTWLPAVVTLVIFLISFRSEVKLVWQLISAYFLVLFLHVNVTLPINPETMRACVVIASNLIIFGFSYLLVLRWISQFTLPVRSRTERLEAFNSLFRYTFAKSLHGPAIFMKDGKPKAEEGELKNLHAGVAFVDLNSAIVLEEQSGSNDAMRQEIHFDSLSEESAESKSPRPSFWKKVLNLFGFGRSKTNVKIVRTLGPGIVFTKRGEKIVGWADLRKQSRTREDVIGSTRDGIEVKTKISVAFTLGQKEETLKVTRVNGNWLVIQTTAAPEADPINRALPPLSLGIKKLSDELDDKDKEEIERYFNQGELEWLGSGSQVGETKSGSAPQFIFDAERVFAAVYSRARDAKDGVLGEWTDLPGYTATEVFRDLLAHENYDDLYLPDDPKKFPLSEFKDKFGQKVRNMGILGYQVVMRKDGTPLKDEQFLREDEFIFSAPRRFERSVVLRDRGIKILSAGFSDLIPTDKVVREQLLENWRAQWQQETQKTLADHELRTMRIHNHERARTQQDMVYSLSRIFRDGHYTDEALAMRLYQALEAAATNPATQRLLPSDTVQMLSNLRQWLLPDNKHADKPSDDSDDVVIPAENSP